MGRKLLLALIPVEIYKPDSLGERKSFIETEQQLLNLSEK
ncbi:hypothetical protein KKY_2152 [Pelagibacterium halotolerans B2]|uniref:Uncharacterized protein n=1 Tax=Pelagibacterium halotolerans (strain DSM 22347 / JCM 15775 / CGMCC 1.7692 / B2) TaxID=1082931 RepID=G4R668_PELHB|nr:hypothetical protein KKY_2152 [Pelagibacterium halotolerans B2]